MHPFAPHLTEEIWQQQGNEGFLVKCTWPKADQSLMQDDTQDIGVQVNGKVRDRILVPVGSSREDMEKMALASEKVQRALEGFEIKKIIVVPNRIVNIVV